MKYLLHVHKFCHQICSYGYFQLSPNVWVPAADNEHEDQGLFCRPLVATSCITVRPATSLVELFIFHLRLHRISNMKGLVLGLPECVSSWPVIGTCIRCGRDLSWLWFLLWCAGGIGDQSFFHGATATKKLLNGIYTFPKVLVLLLLLFAFSWTQSVNGECVCVE